MKTRTFLICLALAASPVVQAQEYAGFSIDSMLTILNTQELTETKRIEDLLSIGIAYNYRGEYETARSYLNQALTVPGGREYSEGRVYVNIANSYLYQGEYAEALKYYMDALEISEEKRIFYPNRLRALSNISNIYYELGNHSRARYYAELVNSGIPPGEGYNYLNSEAFYIIASVCLDKGELDEAEENMLKAYEIACEDSLSNLTYQSSAMNGLAKIYMLRKDHAKALEYAGIGLERAEKLGDPVLLMRTWHVLSNIYLEQKDYRESERAALKALEINPDALKLEPSLAFNLGTISLHLENTEKAYHYFLIYSEQMKLYTDKTFRETLLSMEMQYETEKKEAQIAMLEKSRALYGGIGIASVIALLSAVGMLLFRHQSIIRKRHLAEQQVRQMEQEQQIVIAQASLDGETSERSRLARDLHDGLGGLLAIVLFKLKGIKASSITGEADRLHFSQSVTTLKDSIEELRRITHHLMPRSMENHGLKTAVEDLCRAIPYALFKFYGDENIRLNKYMEITLYRCAYEMVANALKHARASHIHVQLIIESKLVSLNVQDDGAGFDPETINYGAGIENIRTRIASYNGTVYIISTPGKGTEVNIEIEGSLSLRT